MRNDSSPNAFDLAHLQRQIALCERLIASLHQPELLGRLSELRGEYERMATALCAALPADRSAVAGGTAEATPRTRRPFSDPAWRSVAPIRR
jgi:hypothetical protein